MGIVIGFEERAVASLQARLGAAEEANSDLVAFAQGHTGAAAAIHQAVLAAMAADNLEAMFDIVIDQWPHMLGVDCVALALTIGDRGFLRTWRGVQGIERDLVDRAIERVDGVALRGVGRGHPLFGAEAPAIRAEALVAFVHPAPLPTGLLLLGQRSGTSIDGRHGAALLQFLGDALGAMLRRWLIAT